VSLDGLALAGQGDVDEVFIAFQVAQRRHDVALEVVPLQRVVFMGHNGRLVSFARIENKKYQFYFFQDIVFFSSFVFLKALFLTWFLECFFVWLAKSSSVRLKKRLEELVIDASAAISFVLLLHVRM